MKSLKEFININEELDENIFWKIDTYYKDKNDEFKEFNKLVDTCRINKAYNTNTISNYINNNEILSNNIKTFVDFLDDTIHIDLTINKDYISSMYRIIKTIIGNKTLGVKYTNNT